MPAWLEGCLTGFPVASSASFCCWPRPVSTPSYLAHTRTDSAGECEAAYVWAAQVGAARKNGLSEEAIAVVKAKGDPGKLPADERDIVNYMRQVVRGNRVDQALFDSLKSRHSAEWMVQMTAAGTYYMFVSKFINPFEVPAPEDGDKLPS